ncbi:hypothetical protein FOCC_FOCC005622 [Frankliniella occidentalis]|nr:hypothetical protein FOCC_FOCC005622 [Frankliniella occidentalis]
MGMNGSSQSLESCTQDGDPSRHPAINAITVTVAMTTGGQFTLQVDQLESVDTLKKMASKKLRVPKERICLLYRERQLSGGTLLDHQIVNGSRLTLLPNVETGLLVNDFLSGKAPLNLTMRFGDHMMLIQLQLSTVSPQASRSRAASSSASSTSTSSRAVSVSSTAAPSSTSTTTSASTGSSSTSPTASVRSMSTARVRRASAVIPGLVPKSSSSPSSPSRSVTGDAASPSMGPPATPSPASPTRPSAAAPTSSSAPSSPTPGSPCSASSPTPEPLVALPSANACEALLSQLMDSATQAVKASASALSGNSVSDTARTNLFRAIDPSYRTSDEVKSDKSGSSPPSSCPSSSSSCPASPKQSSPVTRKVLIRPATFLAESTSTNASTCTSACSTPVHTSRSTSPMPSASASPPPSANSSNTKGVQTCPEESSGTSASGTSTSTCTCEASRCPMAYRQETRVHTRALAEASRNLMQTLKQLSSEVLTNREEEVRTLVSVSKEMDPILQFAIDRCLEDDDEDFEARLRRPRFIRERLDHFRDLDDVDFVRRFRLSKRCALIVLECIDTRLEFLSNRNQSVSPMNQLLLTLRFYATGCTQLVAADFSGVSESTSHRIIHRVSYEVASLYRQFINFPRNERETQDTMRDFYGISRFPRVIGAIDCTHVKIRSPGGEHAEYFRCRKGYMSLNCQAICNANLEFTDLVARWPGSANDMTIFDNCVQRANFDADRYGDGVLVADSGYSNRKYMMLPLDNPVTREELLYQQSQIRTRNPVERIFGVWKRRFPILAVGINVRLRGAMRIIVACGVLHNILRTNGDPTPPDDPALQLPMPWDQLIAYGQAHNRRPDTAAARRRQGAIIESMHNHGKGVYSGTFSGTLNPALQDRFGRPKRDISTVIHILNDLLCATPQYRRSYQGLPQSNFVLEPNSSSTSSTTPSSGETTDTQSAPPQSSDDAENQATRGKVERLRLVMEERRERRRARREARHSPYGSSQPQHWTAKSETQPAGKSSEAMDTDQPLCDISPPEPVVA